MISHLYWSWVRDQDRPLTRWLEIFSGMPEGGVDRERDHKREEDWLETHRSVIWERWPWCCLRPWQWPQEASIQGAGWAERQTEAGLNSSQGRKQQKCETLISHMKSKRGEENWVWIGSASERGRVGSKNDGFPLTLWLWPSFLWRNTKLCYASSQHLLPPVEALIKGWDFLLLWIIPRHLYLCSLE